MKGTADFYNKTASDWAEKGYGSEAEIPCLLEFIKQFAPGSKFLDLCCGAGYESQRIRAFGYDVVGIDFSEESLRIAREKNPNNDNLLNDNIAAENSNVTCAEKNFIFCRKTHCKTPRDVLQYACMRDRPPDEWPGCPGRDNLSVTPFRSFRLLPLI